MVAGKKKTVHLLRVFMEYGLKLKYTLKKELI